MRIQELEKELNITRSNIRFYEKEGLINPPRKENGYREYSEEDIAKLKKIIIFRKLGITVADIKSIFDGTLPLQIAIDNNIDRLHKEIEELNGAIEVCEQIKEDNSDEKDFPQDHFWNVINNREKQGEKFNEIIKDYLKEEITNFSDYVELFAFISLKKVKEKFGLLGSVIVFVLTCAGFALYRCWRVHNFKFSYFIIWFFTPIVGYIVASIIGFPLWLLMRYLRKEHPKLAKVLEIFFAIIYIALILGWLYLIISPVIKLFGFLIFEL